MVLQVMDGDGESAGAYCLVDFVASLEEYDTPDNTYRQHESRKHKHHSQPTINPQGIGHKL